MKKLLLCFCALFVLCACQKFNIGPKGEGEYVIGSATVPFEEANISDMRKKALKQAEYNALEHAVRVFLSSSSTVEFPANVKNEILAKPNNYIRRSYIKTQYRKGENYYLEARVMILVSDLATKIKALEDSAYVKKTNIVVASRETINDTVVIKQYCRQGIYQALKNFPYTLMDGGNLSQSNLDDYTNLVDKAKKEGARFIILADAAAAPLENVSQIASGFKSIRARANVKVVATNNYQLVAETAQSNSGLDAVEELAAQKALTNACEAAAKTLAENITLAVNSAKTFTFIVKDVNTIDRLEQLQNILRELREVEDFTLKKYTNSNATFEVQASVSTSEEFAAKILRKYYANFSISKTGPDLIELQFI
ncbi:MAG: hypothetical protein LBM71_04730 [Elusimicrobiota bacterium]|jgi:mannose/fructose-specific phosphotransferase system component IIA|nr:hypothetical protein [Elusimicrobiota bacterium]